MVVGAGPRTEAHPWQIRELADRTRWRAACTGLVPATHQGKQTMTNDTLTTIDTLALFTVHGGQEMSAGGKFKTPTVEAEGNFSRKGTPERRNDFNTCMNDRQANCGIMQSAQSCQEMGLKACMGLRGSPTNPQTGDQKSD
jgi:hypothetical protein